MKVRILAVALFLTVLAVGVASANSYTVTLNHGTDSLVFQSSPNPPANYVPGFGFAEFVSDVSFNGTPVQDGALVNFFVPPDGVFAIQAPNVFNMLGLDGPQLYSGPESSPELLVGTYDMINTGGSGMFENWGDRVTLTIAPVPEPASMTLGVAGILVVGVIKRRKK